MADQISPEYRDNLRRLSGVQKLRTASALYWGARKVKGARLRSMHPDWSEERVRDEVKRIFMHAVT